MEFPSTRGRMAWWLVAAVLGAVVAGVVFAFLGTFVLGVFFYYVARPAYRRFRRRGVPSSVAAAVALFALALPVVLLMVYTLAVASGELVRLAGRTDLGPIADQIEPYVDVSQFVQDPAALLQNPDVVDALRLVLEGAMEYVPLVGTVLMSLFIAFAVAFYLLRDDHRLSGWLRETLGDDRGVFDEYASAVDQDLESVFFGNILNALITAGIAVVLFSLMNLLAPAEGIPYPALIGVLTGAASLIPVVGMKLVYVPLAVGLGARAAVQGDPLWFPVIFFAVTAVAIDFVPDLLLRPYVSGRNLHVGLVMIAYIVGPLLFGWYGLFLGPLLLVLIFHFGRYVVPELVDGGPMRRRTSSPSPDGVPRRVSDTEGPVGVPYVDQVGVASDGGPELQTGGNATRVGADRDDDRPDDHASDPEE